LSDSKRANETDPGILGAGFGILGSTPGGNGGGMPVSGEGLSLTLEQEKKTIKSVRHKVINRMTFPLYRDYIMIIYV